MQAIVRTGGKQYRVKEGDVIKVERLDGEIGSEVILEDILMVSCGEEKNADVMIGAPNLPEFKIKGEILDQNRKKKIVVFTYKRRKGSKRKKGHRQYYTKIKVLEILGALPQKPKVKAEKKTKAPTKKQKEQESEAKE